MAPSFLRSAHGYITAVQKAQHLLIDDQRMLG